MIQGRGDKDRLMNELEAQEVLEQGLGPLPLDKKRVLVLTPDSTRSGPMPMIFKLLCQALLPRVKKLDYLIALGTHQPLSEGAQNKLYDISDEDRKTRYVDVEIHNHRWDRAHTFKQIGTISSREMERLSGGLLRQEAVVALNKLIFDYDHIIIYGPVFPHEVAGFSGGHKYLFPGIAGEDIINITHWMGALITNYQIIGRKETPVREAIELAASMVDRPVIGVCSVVKGAQGLAGLYVGEVKQAWSRAADLSAQVHVRWVESPYQLVISLMPELYDDIWTGAKGMYKVEPAVADSGEVIIYAPHISELSYTHGRLLDQVGYHVRDYFVKQWDRFSQYPGAVLAHSTHVKGMGAFEHGEERPRVKVTLATGIPKERCQALSLGYLDPRELDLASYENREREGILVVPRAGEVLYRLQSQREDVS